MKGDYCLKECPLNICCHSNMLRIEAWDVKYFFYKETWYISFIHSKMILYCKKKYSGRDLDAFIIKNAKLLFKSIVWFEAQGKSESMRKKVIRGLDVTSGYCCGEETENHWNTSLESNKTIFQLHCELRALKKLLPVTKEIILFLSNMCSLLNTVGVFLSCKNTNFTSPWNLPSHS